MNSNGLITKTQKLSFVEPNEKPRIIIKRDDTTYTHDLVTPPEINNEEEWSPRIEGKKGIE